MDKLVSVIRKSVAVDNQVDRIIERVRVERGLGERGYSAALRLIILDWDNARAGRDVDAAGRSVRSTLE